MILIATLFYDACSYDIKGYSDKGMVWHWDPHPPKWHGFLTLKLLEVLASAIPIYMTIHQLG